MDYVIKYFKDYIDATNEGLIITHDIKIIYDNLMRSFSNLNLNTPNLNLKVSGELLSNKFVIIFDNFKYIPITQIENLLNHMHSFTVNMGGWFPSKYEETTFYGVREHKYEFNKILENYQNIDIIKIYFEAKFDQLEPNIPDILYHLSIKEYSKKIRKIGLIPKSSSKLSTHLERIYVCKNIQDCKGLITQMIIYYSGIIDFQQYIKKNKLFNMDVTPVIWEIDNTTHFITKMYKDPNYPNGYYILDNVNKKNLKEISL